MALTISEAGKNKSTTSNKTLTVTATVSFAVGDMAVIIAAGDNSGTSGTTGITIGGDVSNTKGNVSTERMVVTRDPALVNAGCDLAIYTCPITTAMTTSDSWTINWFFNTPSKAAVVFKVSPGAGEVVRYVSRGLGSFNTADAAIATTSITSGHTVIGGLSHESNFAITGDSDTSNGSWSALYTDVADTGTSGTSIRVAGQYKTVTATATQTWNLTIAASDWAIGYIVVAPANLFQRTATNSGTGTQSATGQKLIVKTRTATGTGTGAQSATGKIVVVVTRTATDSGTGTQSANRLTVRLRTAMDSVTGTQSASLLTIRPRTATASGTGASSASTFVIRSRTASASGTGTSAASGLRIVLRSVSASGTGTSSTVGVLTAIRTAQASGHGTSTADGERVVPRSATASGQGSTAGDAVGLHIAPRTAIASGTGASSSARVIVKLRTASASGIGTSSADRLRIVPRTATATGTGGSSATAIEVLPRTATASGQGSTAGGATGLHIAPRTATAVGTGSHSVVRVLVAKRTASASGAGTQVCVGVRISRRSATASGIGSSSATQNKLFIFRTPTSELPAADFFAKDIANRLFSYATPGTRGKNIYKLTDGSYTDVDPRDPNDYTKLYYGGRNNFVSADEKADLVSAGYGEYVT